jgi:hypothetical protein
MTGLSRRGVLLALLLIALAAGVTMTVLFAPRYLERHRYAMTQNGCKNVPMAPAVTPQTHPGSILWPYGAVHSCRVLDSQAHLSGRTDVSFTLLLETDKGPVLVRMDYFDIDLGRRYVAAATELDPAGVDLPYPVVTRIEQAIAGRGGLEPVPWIVHYGDG